METNVDNGLFTAMVVAWNTFQQIGTPTVHYGLTPVALISNASSKSSVTFSTSRTWANTVLLTGLLPYTTYCKHVHKLSLQPRGTTF